MQQRCLMARAGVHAPSEPVLFIVWGTQPTQQPANTTIVYPCNTSILSPAIAGEFCAFASLAVPAWGLCSFLRVAHCETNQHHTVTTVHIPCSPVLTPKFDNVAWALTQA